MSLIRRSAAGVSETSYYGPLEALLNEVGKTLKPKVRCVINLADKGAGIPDGGLFTADQFQKRSDDLIEGQLPARGAIEIKGTSDEVDQIKDTAQVAKYLAKYGQVLVTNYRDFLLVTLDENGKPKPLERYNLADNETDFWQNADRFAATSDTDNERFVDFLKRVMLHAAPIAKPEDVAWFLASYARDARARVEAADVSALEMIRKALEELLGIKFEGEKGEHFFRSTLVQTLFYGVFSAWVLWHKRHSVSSPHVSKGSFQWRTSVWELKVPMISVLFGQLATPANVKQLDLEEVLDWTENVLNRVAREEFFARFAEEHAVQYFYEPFLQAFDPELRKQLGVWYTPEEIVRYMVARVDRMLREELDLADGLADESVYVLDPACGTGAYLVEVLKRISRTLEEKGQDSIRGQKLKKAVMTRVFGFEILPAPFVVSHLQVGLLLEQLGVGFSEDKSERAGVYLTNSLTGWEEHPKKTLPFPELEEERDRAEKVKKNSQILVVIGNPPYNGYAGVAVGEERELSNAYRTTKHAPKPEGHGLNELFVRFYRMAERRIIEMSGKGIVCYITNSAWLEGASHPGMREKFIDEFDKIWIDNLNGDKYKTGKTTPDGKPDPSVFSTKWNREGIQVGTAISTLVRKPQHEVTKTIQYREFWGVNKLDQIVNAATQVEQIGYVGCEPELALGLVFSPSVTYADYLSWPLLDEICPVSFPGIKTSRDEALTAIVKGDLESRISQYFDPSKSDTELLAIAPKLVTDASRFKFAQTRKYLVQRGINKDGIVPYSYRPFDLRWLYWEPETKLLDEKRPEYVQHVFDGNYWIAATKFNRKDFDPPVALRRLGSLHLIERGANLFPLFLKKSKQTLFESDGDLQPNLSDNVSEYLAVVSATPEGLFFHTLAILHSKEYAKENGDALRHNFPRIPLPASHDDLTASAELGKRVAALFDTEKEVVGVTAGSIIPELRELGVSTHVEGKQFGDDDLKVTAGWGHAGKGGVTMPGKGKLETRDERPETGESKLSFDVYMNNVAFWRNVPEPVWNYYIGGYQVIKKWLSYREYDLLGRPLNLEEVEEVTNMIRRIAALLLMEPELNENYQRIKANTVTLPRTYESTEPVS